MEWFITQTHLRPSLGQEAPIGGGESSILPSLFPCIKQPRSPSHSPHSFTSRGGDTLPLSHSTSSQNHQAEPAEPVLMCEWTEVHFTRAEHFRRKSGHQLRFLSRQRHHRGKRVIYFVNLLCQLFHQHKKQFEWTDKLAEANGAKNQNKTPGGFSCW